MLSAETKARLITFTETLIIPHITETEFSNAVQFIKLVASLATSLFQQACYKSAAGLLQVVRFCVWTLEIHVTRPIKDA